MTEKKKRNITPTGFLSRLTKVQEKNKSAEGFLSQHREFLLTGALYEITTPILVRADKGEINSNEAIGEMIGVVFQHIRDEAARKFLSLPKQKEIVKKSPGTKKAATSPVMARILDRNGNPAIMKSESGEEIENEKGFNLGQEAERWVDRRLTLDAESGCYGEIVHQKVFLKGELMKDIVSREDAFYRLHGAKNHGPVMKRTPRSVSRLKSVMRVHESRSVFSGA